MGPAGEHPDADVLSAFAEGALLESERGAVLAHLAGCAECRAVLSLIAEEPRGIAEVRPFPVRRRPRVWIPWGAVAAGIAVACGIALYRVERKPVYAPTTAQNQEKPAAPPPQEIAQLQAPANEPRTEKKKTASSAPEKSSKSATPDRVDAMAGLQEDKNATDLLKLAPGVASGGAPAAEKPKAEAQLRSRDLAVDTRTTAAFSSMAAAKSVAAGEVARSVVAQNEAAPVARPHWRLNEEGQPQRAFGNGAWQPALAGGPAKMRVVSIIGDEVWAGGADSQVYRSADEGSTWRAVPLPVKNGAAHTIVHIRFETAQMGTIEAADGTSWQTADGGRTWQ